MTPFPPGVKPVTLDPDAISRFADLVFGYLEGFAPVRAFSEKGTPEKRPVTAFPEVHDVDGTLQRMAPTAASEGRGLYIVPATVARAATAKAADIVQTGMVVVDIDTGAIGKICHHLRAHLGAPSLDVASGGFTEAGEAKRHLYWKLTEAACHSELERVRSLRETIARKVGADPSFGSLHQPIRVPGSIHGKDGVQSTVRIISDTGIEYDLVDLAEKVVAMPTLERADHVRPQNVGRGASTFNVGDLATLRVRENCTDGISRYEALSKVIGHWVRNIRYRRCDLQEAWAAVQEYNTALISPPWGEARLRREFDAIVRLDASNNGPAPSCASEGPAKAEGKAIPRSEDALALEFVRRGDMNWRHTSAWGAWSHWEAGKWRRDELGSAREQMRIVCRDGARTADKSSEARRISSDKTITAALRIASSDGRVATRSTDWDAHPWLLNTPSGIVDLETGELRPHDRGLLITQMTGANPGGPCPRWKTFLDEITNGDPDLKSYFARLAGYCLTGVTREQVFAFLHGGGANGKSVFLSTLSAVLGDYAATATQETFMASRSDRHLTELAGLRAARLVVVPETEPGRSWAEGRIKSVTGGEKIRANYMRQDHFEFTPQFKLLVAGNHRPALTGLGEAMRRRLHLVPFDVTIPAEQRDRNLITKLLGERDGILAWMIDGCAEWQRDGLAPPQGVQAAATAYFDDEDVVGQWLEECCDTGAVHKATARSLFTHWSRWADQAGHTPGSQKALGTALRERGFEGCKVNGQRGWIGLRLKTLPEIGGQPG